ncbi:hypothetical protein THAOC_22893 [Thalassiosira oceanica]|uniref:phosphoribosylaminoimidazole carboxylase n=1 Tax=Thalassiosira oceanica TaxID=159749 RepID=K0SER5_THAOC|nr:hypothetical protein THAOC_22893 [Thalassiosira oceanica]|eukprot:EJK57102.1 hypothetical protein THAOC_22893 [Thalassiosira oceanica]
MTYKTLLSECPVVGCLESLNFPRNGTPQWKTTGTSDPRKKNDRHNCSVRTGRTGRHANLSRTLTHEPRPLWVIFCEPGPDPLAFFVFFGNALLGLWLLPPAMPKRQYAIFEHLQSLSNEEDLDGELDHADAMSEHLQSLLMVLIPYRLDQFAIVLPVHLQSPSGFPEAVFGGKTPSQLRSILQSMTDNVNTRIESAREGGDKTVDEISTAIIATRVDKETYEAVVLEGPLEGGTVEYHETARIISVKADAVDDNRHVIESSSSGRPSVVVACAGTTDLPVAEEAALTLSLCGIRVERVYDCGVAGLHRIIGALPRLRDPAVGCVIVCAGMDGALPSVVGGLVDVPTVACPTSVGYGASFNGVASLLTMLNSCSPGVSVVNIDNGFGAAVFALKVVNAAAGMR